MERTDNNDPLIFGLSYLQANTGEVIRRMNEENRNALITHMGRFVARMEPLAKVGVESDALSKSVDQDTDTSKLYTPEETLAKLQDQGPDTVDNV